VYIFLIMSEDNVCIKIWKNVWSIINIIIGPIDPRPYYKTKQSEDFPVAIVYMLIYAGWCSIVLNTGIYKTTPDLSKTFNIVGATLAFILPLVAANAVNRNKEILNNYKAFCGDVLALGWEVLAYVREEKRIETTNGGGESKQQSNEKLDESSTEIVETVASKKSQERIQQLFEICLVLPTMVKWKNRKGKLDIEKIYLVKHAEQTEKELKDNGKKTPTVFDTTNTTNTTNTNNPMIKNKARMSTFGNFQPHSIKFDQFDASKAVITEEDIKNEETEIRDKFYRQFISTSTGKIYKQLYDIAAKKKITKEKEIIVIEKGIDECDLAFAMMNKIVSEFDTNGDTRKNMLTRTIERVYSSYGNIGNISAYRLPLVYNVYLYTSMLIFVLLYPLNYDKSGDKLETINNSSNGDFEVIYEDEISDVSKHGYNIIYHGFIIIYFMFGFHYMTQKVGDVFRSSKIARGYQTVGNDESDINNSLIGLWKTRNKYYGETVLSFIPDSRINAETKTNESSRLHRRRRLYV
jgi:hypothetical protein